MKKISNPIHKIKKILLPLALSISLPSIFSSPLFAILDGRTAPIYLDSVYTFTQGEWARGSVFFRQGFDLPVGGTVYLGIDGGFVNGPIRLNGGTLVLEKPIVIREAGYFIAGGFISGTPGQPDSMLINYESGLWSGAGTVKFIKTSMTFLGNLAIMDSSGVTIDLREAGGDIFFVGGKIILRKLLTSTTTPARIWFVNTNIVATGSSFIFNNPEIYFAGNVSLTNSFSIVTLKKMVLLPFTKMIAYPDCAINLNQISIPYEGTRLEIRRSSLNFTSTSTSAIRIVTPYAHNSQGTLALDGKCRFSSTTNNTLIFDKYAKLELLSSAELTLAQGTKLVFE